MSDRDAPATSRLRPGSYHYRPAHGVRVAYPLGQTMAALAWKAFASQVEDVCLGDAVRGMDRIADAPTIVSAWMRTGADILMLTRMQGPVGSK
jgi:hypothetical protein